MKSLNGAEIAGYMKENQAHRVLSLRGQGVRPKLVIIRDNRSPVIEKYVHLKERYGNDIGVEVGDWLADDLAAAIEEANADATTHAIIVQLPLQDPRQTDEVVKKIVPEKDVDGLAHGNIFDSATATAIHWLLNGYDIDLNKHHIALVGRGRLVGGPLEEMWRKSGYDVTVFRSHDDLAKLIDYDLIVTATGVPHLIRNEMVRPGAIVVDAGTASEGGLLVGDVSDEVRARTDLAALTPKVGGVGPLTVTALFEHVLMAAQASVQ